MFDAGMAANSAGTEVFASDQQISVSVSVTFMISSIV